jgi:ABC-type transporter Mla subunit MlaD
MQNYASALKGGADGLKKVFNNIISQDPSRSMAKYSDGLSTLGDAAAKAAENFGPLGKVVGATIQGFTKIAGMQMQQADLLLKANDQLAQFGTAGSFTTKELMDMAHGAGVTSKNMDTLINPIKSIGHALTRLVGTASEGVKAFASMTKITNQQREEFQ